MRDSADSADCFPGMGVLFLAPPYPPGLAASSSYLERGRALQEPCPGCIPFAATHSWGSQTWNGRTETARPAGLSVRGQVLSGRPHTRPHGKPQASSANSPVSMSSPHRLHSHRLGPGVGNGWTGTEAPGPPAQPPTS